MLSAPSNWALSSRALIDSLRFLHLFVLETLTLKGCSDVQRCSVFRDAITALFHKSEMASVFVFLSGSGSFDPFYADKLTTSNVCNALDS